MRQLLTVAAHSSTCPGLIAFKWPTVDTLASLETNDLITSRHLADIIFTFLIHHLNLEIIEMYLLSSFGPKPIHSMSELKNLYWIWTQNVRHELRKLLSLKLSLLYFVTVNIKVYCEFFILLRFTPFKQNTNKPQNCQDWVLIAADSPVCTALNTKYPPSSTPFHTTAASRFVEQLFQHDGEIIFNLNLILSSNCSFEQYFSILPKLFYG